MTEPIFNPSDMTDREWRIWQAGQMAAIRAEVSALGIKLEGHMLHEDALLSDHEARLRAVERGQIRNTTLWSVLTGALGLAAGFLYKLKG